jgi:hypothetical protein
VAQEDLTHIDLKAVGAIMLAVHGTQQTAAAFGAERSGQTPLSARSALLCILGLSAIGWAVVLLPLWAVIG